jgi:hypothetical protein
VSPRLCPAGSQLYAIASTRDVDAGRNWARRLHIGLPGG